MHRLAVRINTEINAAAAVTPINLVAMAVLATPRQAMSELDLVAQIELYQALLRAAPYSPLVTLPAESGQDIVRYAEKMGILERQTQVLGDILRMSEENAVLATYYRNNVLHLFAMPSLLACCFVNNARMRTVDIQRMVWRVYPYVCAELFMRWGESEIAAVTDRLLDTLAKLGLLQDNEERSEWQRPPPNAPEAMRLSLLAQATIQTIERYYLAVALLLQAGSGVITQALLEERCHLMAQRMSVLYGLNSPEFFDKSLFRGFIHLLLKRNVIQTDAEAQAAVRRAVARCGGGCAAGAVGADPPQHPAGHSGVAAAVEHVLPDAGSGGEWRRPAAAAARAVIAGGCEIDAPKAPAARMASP